MTNSDKQIEKIIALMQRDDSVDAPADSVKWVKNVFRSSRAHVPEASLIKRIFAVLQIDLAPDRAAFGERSAAARQARQMLFEADEYAVDLRVKATGKNYEIRGQILGEGFENSTVKLQSGESASVAEADDLSEFRFDGVARGEYVLEIVGKDAEIVVEKLDIFG